jgi:nucleoside-diphosphate-sugar epimerase
MTQIDPDAPVLVTGGRGYIASWIVRYLLEEGHTVRATVRDPNRASGLEHLHRLSEAHPGQLTLHAADLLADASFSAPMADCQLVIHTASPFLVGRIRDPQRQLIRPALEGTQNVLGSVNATDSVRRVVLTSSVAAIYGDNVDTSSPRTTGTPPAQSSTSPIRTPRRSPSARPGTCRPSRTAGTS